MSDKRESYLALLKVRLAFMKGEMIQSVDFVALAESLDIPIHGQTRGKLGSVVKSINRYEQMELREKVRKAEVLRGCRMLVKDVLLAILLKEFENK